MLVLYLNGWTYCHAFFTTRQPIHSSFIRIQDLREIPTGAQNRGGVWKCCNLCAISFYTQTTQQLKHKTELQASQHYLWSTPTTLCWHVNWPVWLYRGWLAKNWQQSAAADCQHHQPCPTATMMPSCWCRWESLTTTCRPLERTSHLHTHTITSHGNNIIFPLILQIITSKQFLIFTKSQKKTWHAYCAS